MLSKKYLLGSPNLKSAFQRLSFTLVFLIGVQSADSKVRVNLCHEAQLFALPGNGRGAVCGANTSKLTTQDKFDAVEREFGVKLKNAFGRDAHKLTFLATHSASVYTAKEIDGMFENQANINLEIENKIEDLWKYLDSQADSMQELLVDVLVERLKSDPGFQKKIVEALQEATTTKAP